MCAFGLNIDMNDTISHIIYDSLKGEDIIFYKGELIRKCKELGIDNTKISKLKSRGYDFVYERYILSERKDEILFTLIDFETEEEFECVSNKTIFLHLNLPYSETCSKYIYELKRKRQYVATICNRLFYLKGVDKPTVIKTVTKLDHLASVKKCKSSNRAQQRMRGNFRSRLGLMIRERLMVKQYGHMQDLLGCNKDFFIEYIESQFTGEICWDNYGKVWHIDHIIPCFMFDLFDSEQVKQCWHYTNLRPLLATENLARPKNRPYYNDSLIKKSSSDPTNTPPVRVVRPTVDSLILHTTIH